MQGYELLESRPVYERMLALEDERAGLKAQLERFSRRVSEYGCLSSFESEKDL